MLLCTSESTDMATSGNICKFVKYRPKVCNIRQGSTLLGNLEGQEYAIFH